MVEKKSRARLYFVAFLLPDLVKIVLSATLARRLKKLEPWLLG